MKNRKKNAKENSSFQLDDNQDVLTSALGNLSYWCNLHLFYRTVYRHRIGGKI